MHLTCFIFFLIPSKVFFCFFFKDPMEAECVKGHFLIPPSPQNMEFFKQLTPLLNKRKNYTYNPPDLMRKVK